MIYKFEVMEIRSYDMIYHIEADNPEEARNKAVIGETIEEEEISVLGVEEREVYNLLTSEEKT